MILFVLSLLPSPGLGTDLSLDGVGGVEGREGIGVVVSERTDIDEEEWVREKLNVERKKCGVSDGRLPILFSSRSLILFRVSFRIAFVRSAALLRASDWNISSCAFATCIFSSYASCASLKAAEGSWRDLFC